MKKPTLIAAALVLLNGCGAGSSGIDSAQGDCAANTKVVHVVDETVSRNSYHFFHNSCNNLMYTGTNNGSEIWGYQGTLPNTGIWWHNIESYSLKRNSGTYEISARFPRAANSDEQNQNAVVCQLDASANGSYNSSRIIVDRYDITENCYAVGVENPIISTARDYTDLTSAQVALFESTILNGNPNSAKLAQALDSSNAKVCKVGSDGEIGSSPCAQ